MGYRFAYKIGIRMDNYAIMRQDAVDRFRTYEVEKILENPGVSLWEKGVQTTFFSMPVHLNHTEGSVVLLDGEKEIACDFSPTLSILDYVCDRKPFAIAANVFCPVGSLPGVFVGGSGLVMKNGALESRIEKDPEGFKKACESLGGVATEAGDMGYRLHIFPDLCMELKFYFADEDFPPQLTYLWDKNTLQFVRYETVYYIADCLSQELCSRMEHCPAVMID